MIHWLYKKKIARESLHCVPPTGQTCGINEPSSVFFISTPLSLLLMTLCVPLDIFLEIIDLSVTSSVVEIHPTFDSWIFDMVSFPNKCQYGVPWPQEKHIWKKWLPYFPSIKIKFLPRPSPELVQTNTLIYCVTYFSVGLLSPFSTILSPLYMVILYWPPPHFWYQTI